MADATHKPFAAVPDPAPDILVEARRRYEAGQVTMTALAAEFGIGRATLSARIARVWKWKAPRKRRKTVAGKPKPKPKPKTKTSAKAKPKGRIGGLRTKVRGALQRHLSKLESGLQGLPEDADMERTARILASLVKTLAELARLDGASGGRSKGAHAPNHDPNHAPADAADGAEPAVDLAGLRADLARRLGGALRGGADAGDSQDL
jgi:hypothetical protein